MVDTMYHIHYYTPCAKSLNDYWSFRHVIWFLAPCFKLLSILQLAGVIFTFIQPSRAIIRRYLSYGGRLCGLVDSTI